MLPFTFKNYLQWAIGKLYFCDVRQDINAVSKGLLVFFIFFSRASSKNIFFFPTIQTQLFSFLKICEYLQIFNHIFQAVSNFFVVFFLESLLTIHSNFELFNLKQCVILWQVVTQLCNELVTCWCTARIGSSSDPVTLWPWAQGKNGHRKWMDRWMKVQAQLLPSVCYFSVSTFGLTLYGESILYYVSYWSLSSLG